MIPIARRPPLVWMILVPVVVTMSLGFASSFIYIDRVTLNSRLADVDAELARARPPTASTRTSSPSGQNESASDATSKSGLPSFAVLASVDAPTQATLDSAGNVLEVRGPKSTFDLTTLRSLANIEGVHTTIDGNYRFQTARKNPGETVVTILSLAGLKQAQRNFRTSMALAMAAILLIQCLIVWLVTKRLVQPVIRMTRVASLVADGAVDTEVGKPSGPRETATLAVDLDRMLVRIRSTLADREQAAHEAIAARDDMRRLVADISHEFRTPLTALNGYSQLYVKGLLAEPEALDRAMRRVGSESQRLHDLVSNMLRLARSSPTLTDLQTFRASELVRSIVADLQTAHPDRNIKLASDETLDDEITAVSSDIHQVILNLGSNAIAHTHQAIPVEIVVQPTPSALRVHVVDHGPGIPDVDGERIFLPFVRLDQSRSRSHSGTGSDGAGLGLALAKQLAERNGGTITLEGTPGGGSTFTLTIPRGNTTKSIDADPSAASKSRR